MNRNTFLKLISSTCLVSGGVLQTLTGCTTVHRVSVVAQKARLTVPKTEFNLDNGNSRAMILVKEYSQAFPIALYRSSPNEYTALWMECTHQGCEVKAQPHYLVCPCHGSEYDANGNVVLGPAEVNLKSFDLTTDHENIYIHL